MVRMKKLICLILPLLLLCGCSLSVEELLSPPRLDEEQTAIYEALRLSKGGDVNLKYPMSGQYRSAFVVQNIDDEESNEAIVFYEASNITDDGSSLRLNFLDKQDGKWVSVYDFAALGSEVERVLFADLGDDALSIIVTYPIQNSSDHATSIFRYENNTPSEVYKSRHVYMSLIDINEDNAQEVFMVNSDSSSNVATANLLGWEDDSFSVLSSVPLSAGFTSCRNIQLATATSMDRKGIFIDYSLADGATNTDILLCYDRTLVAAQIPDEQTMRRSNSYTPLISCRDNDADGVIEIPVVSPAPGYESRPANEQVNFIHWFELAPSGNALEHEAITYVSIRNDYMLSIPSRWAGLVTCSISIADGTVTFNKYNPVTKEAEDELMVIRAVSEAAMEKADLSGFTPYGKSAATGYSFFIRTNTENSFAMSEAELGNMFSITE